MGEVGIGQVVGGRGRERGLLLLSVGGGREEAVRHGGDGDSRLAWRCGFLVLILVPGGGDVVGGRRLERARNAVVQGRVDDRVGGGKATSTEGGRTLLRASQSARAPPFSASLLLPGASSLHDKDKQSKLTFSSSASAVPCLLHLPPCQTSFVPADPLTPPSSLLLAKAAVGLAGVPLAPIPPRTPPKIPIDPPPPLPSEPNALRVRLALPNPSFSAEVAVLASPAPRLPTREGVPMREGETRARSRSRGSVPRVERSRVLVLPVEGVPGKDSPRWDCWLERDVRLVVG